MATMVKVTCACGCGKSFESRAADVKRGWGKYYDKSHKAVAQERRTGQHAAHKARMHRIDEDDIDGDWLLVGQGKTGKRLRLLITGALADLLARINERKAGCKEASGYLLVNKDGRKMTRDALRYQYDKARESAAAGNADLDEEIKKMWFYDLRAKAADDSADARGEQAASDLLGHDSVKTTRRHYLRRGKIVVPTK